MAKVPRSFLFQFGPIYSTSLGSSNGLGSRFCLNPKKTNEASVTLTLLQRFPIGSGKAGWFRFSVP